MELLQPCAKPSICDVLFHRFYSYHFADAKRETMCILTEYIPHGTLESLVDSLSPWVLSFHDDVIKRKHFPRHWPFVRGIHRSPVNSPHKSQWRGSLMFSLISAWINGLVNNAEVGDLRRHRAHYDVTLMYTQFRWSDMPWRSCDVAVMKWWNIKIYWYLHVISKQFIMSSPVVKKRATWCCGVYLLSY